MSGQGMYSMLQKLEKEMTHIYFHNKDENLDDELCHYMYVLNLALFLCKQSSEHYFSLGKLIYTSKSGTIQVKKLLKIVGKYVEEHATEQDKKGFIKSIVRS